jgi:hypothetical protein
LDGQQGTAQRGSMSATETVCLLRNQGAAAVGGQVVGELAVAGVPDDARLRQQRPKGIRRSTERWVRA